MNKYLLTIALMGSIVGFSACTKNKMRVATIVQTGDITYEGCGYLLKMEEDGQLVKPSHLPAAYQHDNIQVEVNYNHTGVVDTCNYGPKIYDLVNIIDIRLQN